MASPSCHQVLSSWLFSSHLMCVFLQKALRVHLGCYRHLSTSSGLPHPRLHSSPELLHLTLRCLRVRNSSLPPDSNSMPNCWAQSWCYR